MSDQRPMLKRLRRAPVVTLGLVASAVVGFVINEFGPGAIEELRGGSPVRMVVGENADIYGDGWDLALAGELPEDPPPAEAGCQGVRRWLLRHGAVDVPITHLRVAVEGVHRAPTLIRNIRARVEERAEPIDRTLVSCPSAGAQDVIEIGFDLDEQSPVARFVEEDGSLGDPYFEQSSISVAQGEILDLSVRAITERCACSWVLELEIVSDGEPQVLRLDDDGKSFRTTARVEAPGSSYVYAWWEPEPALVPCEDVDACG